MKHDDILGLFHILLSQMRRTPQCPPHGQHHTEGKPFPPCPPTSPNAHHPFRERGRILITLEQKDGITQKHLAELLDIRPQSLSELLGKLESDEMITRVINEQDKRETLVFLSETGKARMEEIKQRREAFAREFLSPLDESEKDELRRLLRKLIDGSHR